MLKLFFSYSKHDRPMLDYFLQHLSVLIRQGKIEGWNDFNILPGEEWDDAIKKNLAEADIILLLVSAHFLGTDYIWRVEIETAMQRHRQGLAKVIPIILKPCDWGGTPFSSLNGLPSKGKPVSTYSNQDEAWLEVVQGIKRVLEAGQPHSQTQEELIALTNQSLQTYSDSHKRVNLHKLLDAIFKDEELTLFCQLHFQAVYNNFTIGQSKAVRLMALMDYVQRYLEMEKLLQLLEKENPAQFDRFKPYF